MLDVLARILVRISVSVSASWNAGFRRTGRVMTDHERINEQSLFFNDLRRINFKVIC